MSLLPAGPALSEAAVGAPKIDSVVSRGMRRARFGVAAAARGSVVLVGLVAVPVAPAAAADGSCTDQRTGPAYVKERSAALNQMGVASVWPWPPGVA